MSNVQAGLFEETLLFQNQPETPVAEQVVNIYAVGTSTPASLYTDHIAGTAAANPVVTDALGNYGFYAAPGDYDRVYTWGGETIRQTIHVDEPEAAIAVTNPAPSSGTSLQNTTAQDQTWEIPLTSTGVGTYRIQKGPLNTVASTDTGTLALASAVTGVISTVVPAGWWLKITVANVTIGTVAAFNR